MNAKVEDRGEKQFGLQLALGSDEIDRLIEDLSVLRRDRPHESRIGDIEVSTLAANDAHNMQLTSIAPAALIAFHSTAVLSNTRKARLPGIIAALLVLVVLGELLRRPSAYSAR